MRPSTSTTSLGPIRIRTTRAGTSCSAPPGGRTAPTATSSLLVAEVVESDAHLAELLASVGADDHLLVRLEARPETCRERIVEREPPSWSGLEHLLSEMERWAVSLTELDGVHLVLDSEGIGPDELAARIRAERPDKLGG